MFKERLEMAMAMSGLNAAELSRKSGISEGMISSYRKGTYAPKSKKIFALATALNVSPSWLLGYDSPEKEADLDQAHDRRTGGRDDRETELRERALETRIDEAVFSQLMEEIDVH